MWFWGKPSKMLKDGAEIPAESLWQIVKISLGSNHPRSCEAGKVKKEVQTYLTSVVNT